MICKGYEVKFKSCHRLKPADDRIIHHLFDCIVLDLAAQVWRTIFLYGKQERKLNSI
jgi:hypothetical protein